ncbi:GNAT family N-acetyltransferase [Rhizobium sp. CNPSo 4062]|uniref:GNAT family N-acetyltransferase n=1 Tax=Rhizobium sp. CNPSo 4062 TaxID=3021410 RepID=UPI0025502B00|nr:GNAT family N-acetyltransferase [Rhizobium sp. CNPSo 4062]MDK4706610.1 GNAT family N-acetyltransferase [Rhizobium sp. CNPSo 4062]
MSYETQTSTSSSPLDIRRIETPRLILRTPVHSDGPGLHALLSNPEVCRFSPYPPVTDIADTFFVIVEWREAWEQGLRTYVGADRLDPRNPIGFIQVGLDDELGGLLAPARSGNGLAVEALQAVISTLELRKAWTIIDAEHHALIHTLAKVNIRQEKLLPAYRVHPQISSERRDCVLLCQQSNIRMV